MKTIHHKYVVLFLLFLLFAAPSLIAYLFYHNPDWVASNKTNKGVLLTPPVLLAYTDKAPSASTPKWKLAFWSPDTCGKNCLEQLDKLARIRLALGRHLYEVEIQLLLGAKAPQLSQNIVNALHEQDISILKFSAAEEQGMGILKNKSKIFITNPGNYLVLAYVQTVKPDNIFHDIKQLLKVEK